MRRRPTPRSLTRACAIVSALALGCATRTTSPPPLAPALGTARPAQAIPADLDVALRIDLVGARRALGPEITRELELGVTDAKADPVASALIAATLERAETIWIAFRPGLEARSTDNVIIARGRFGDLDPRSFRGNNPWGPPADLGGDVRLYEREKPARRSAPARLYLLSTSLVVFVSEAEIDSVERAVELRAGDPHLDPPDRGTISVAARIAPLVVLIADRFPAVANVLSGAKEVSGWMSANQAGMRIELSVDFIGGANAGSAAGATEELRRLMASRQGPWALLAKATKIQSVGKSLVLRADFSPERAGGLIACFAYGSGCDDQAK